MEIRKATWVHMFVSVLIMDPRDYLADWELHLTAPAQHHKRGLYSLSLAWGKTQIQNWKYSL